MKQAIYNLFNRPEKNYKPIDGIRAIAILWVIIFHVWLFQYNDYPAVGDKVTEYSLLMWISKGDLGVDLFFVISGYLITNIIIHDLEQDRFSIVEFYERRARRILPALFVVMFSSIPIAWLLLMPVDMKNFSTIYNATDSYSTNSAAHTTQ